MTKWAQQMRMESLWGKAMVDRSQLVAFYEWVDREINQIKIDNSQNDMREGGCSESIKIAIRTK